jgi:Ca2+-binding EF-hand superfamily protein
MLVLCLIGAVAFLIGPSEALPQFGPPGEGGGQRGAGGSGGMQLDPNQWFNSLAGGKDVWVRSEITDPQTQQRFDRTAQQLGVTNGEITRDQFVANMQQRMAQFGQGRRGGGPPRAAGPGQAPATGGASGGGDWVETMFRRLDTNGDGFLNTDEMPPELKADLPRWDTNKDGKIDVNEFKEYMKSRVTQWQNGGQWNGGGSEAETPEEEDAPKRPVVYRGSNLPKDLPPWFQQLDTDKDGQIGLYEWKGSGRSMEEFQKYDRNGDGFITIEEVMAYESAHKPAPAPGQVASAAQPGIPSFGGPRAGGFNQNWQGGAGNGVWQGNPGMRGGWNGGAWNGGGITPGGPGGNRGNWNRGGADGGPPADNAGGNRGGRNRGGDLNGDGGDRGNRNRGGQE